MSRQRQTFTATFRGNVVRQYVSRDTFRTTSIYPRLFAVLTYRKHLDGSVDMRPSVVATFATPQSCFKEIREREVLRQWPGQSFVVPLEPGRTEITEAEVLTSAKGVA